MQPKTAYNLQSLIPEVDRLPKDWRFCVCNGMKVPQGEEWTEHPFTTDKLLKAQDAGVFEDLWLTPSNGSSPFNVPIHWCKAIGLICGEPSGGILMLDHDGRSCDGLIERISGLTIKEALPKSPLVTSGLPGRYQVVYRVPEMFWGVISTKQIPTGAHGADGKPELLEFRWTGAQSIVLGEHPTTGSYKWLHHPEDVPIADAPIWAIEQMLESNDAEIQQQSFKPSGPKPLKYDANDVPPIPLIECVAKVTRMALEGNFNAGRNQLGIVIAQDLMAVAQYLDSVGCPYDGDPSALFFDWCNQVGLDSDTPKGQPMRIWNSATKRNPTPSRPIESIQKTLKWWEWKHKPKSQQQRHFAGSASAPASAEQPMDIANPQDASEVDRLCLDLSLYAQEENYFKRLLLENNLAKSYQLRGPRLDQALKELLPQQEPEFKSIYELIPDLYAQIEARSISSELPGYLTGFGKLDESIQGLQPGDFIVVAARPSMGKTAFLLSVAKNLCEYHEKPVLFFSLEMSRIQLMFRLLASECEIPAQSLAAGAISDHQWEIVSNVIGKIHGLSLHINDSALLTIDLIESASRKMLDQHGSLGMVAVDYLQLLSTDDAENRTIGLSKITRRLKMLARELKTPIVALSQLSRSVEARQDKRPIMSDLRESGAIEQDADLIMMLYRDEYYRPNTIDKGICEVIINKNRNGPTGTVKLLFESQYTKFRNISSTR